MQSWCTQTIIMYLTASALGIIYIGVLLTNRPQTPKNEEWLLNPILLIHLNPIIGKLLSVINWHTNKWFM